MVGLDAVSAIATIETEAIRTRRIRTGQTRIDATEITVEVRTWP
jgi:hypothetical protein